MNHVRNEIWESNGKELDALTCNMQNYPKILAKVSKEIARRDKYTQTIEELMALIINVQSQDANARKEFNTKYAKYCVVPEMLKKLRQNPPAIYFEASKSPQNHLAKTQVPEDKKVFFKQLEHILMGPKRVKKNKSMISLNANKSLKI